MANIAGSINGRKAQRIQGLAWKIAYCMLAVVAWFDLGLSLWWTAYFHDFTWQLPVAVAVAIIATKWLLAILPKGGK